MRKRKKRSETAALLEPFVVLILRHLDGQGLCHAITGSQAFWHLVRGCPVAFASEEEARAVTPANWNIWIMLLRQNDEQRRQAAELCRSVVALIERDPILQRRRMYVVDRDDGDEPFPSRQIGIALDRPGDVYIDLWPGDVGLSRSRPARRRLHRPWALFSRALPSRRPIWTAASSTSPAV